MYFVIPILISVVGGLALLASGAAPYALLTLLAVPTVYMAAKRPTLMCAITVASQAWQVLSIGIITGFKVLMLLMLVQMSLMRKRTDAWHTPPSRYSAVAVAMVIWMCICELGVTEPNFEFLMELLGCVVMYLSMMQLFRTEQDIRTLAWVGSLNMLFIGIWVALEVPWSVMMRGRVRAAGPPGQPNSLGEFVVLTSPLTLAFILDRTVPTWQRTVAAVTAGFGLYTLFGSASRSAFVADTPAGRLGSESTSIQIRLTISLSFVDSPRCAFFRRFAARPRTSNET